jgi:hypothetical protein
MRTPTRSLPGLGSQFTSIKVNSMSKTLPEHKPFETIDKSSIGKLYITGLSLDAYVQNVDSRDMDNFDIKVKEILLITDILPTTKDYDQTGFQIQILYKEQVGYLFGSYLVNGWLKELKE